MTGRGAGGRHGQDFGREAIGCEALGGKTYGEPVKVVYLRGGQELADRDVSPLELEFEPLRTPCWMSKISSVPPGPIQSAMSSE